MATSRLRTAALWAQEESVGRFGSASGSQRRAWAASLPQGSHGAPQRRCQTAVKPLRTRLPSVQARASSRSARAGAARRSPRGGSTRSHLGGNSRPRGFGQLALARPSSARLSAGRPPASASLGHLADMFWLAGYTGLVLHTGWVHSPVPCWEARPTSTSPRQGAPPPLPLPLLGQSDSWVLVGPRVVASLWGWVRGDVVCWYVRCFVMHELTRLAHESSPDASPSSPQRCCRLGLTMRANARGRISRLWRSCLT